MNSRKHPAITLLSFVLLVALLLTTLTVVRQTRADTLCVHPAGAHGCYTTIQAGVDAASDGDTIDVAQAPTPAP